MTLLASLAALCGVLFSGFLFAGLGRFLLVRARLSIENRVERCLASIAGIQDVFFELLVSLGELAPHVRAGVLSALTLAVLLGLLSISAVSRDAGKSFDKLQVSRGWRDGWRWGSEASCSSKDLPQWLR